jgi:zinc protease
MINTINRKLKPVPAKEISFILPQIEEFKLENGLNILFVKKTNLPIIQLILLTDAGSKFDAEDKKGLANLTGMLTDEGAGGMDALQLSEEFDMLGSSLSINVDEDSILISLKTLKNNFNKSLELYSKIITEPHFDEKSFPREQRKVLTRILQRKDQPDKIANLIMEYSIFGQENPYAYSIRGYENSLLNINNRDIKDYYENFVRPSNSTLIVVGDTSENELKDLLNKNLNRWKPAENISLHITDSIRSKSKIIICNKENAAQSEIRAAHITSKRNEGNFFAKYLMNLVLGGQFSSRINLNLREDKGYTYGATSRIFYFKEAGYFYVSTSTATENTGNTLKEILFELNRIREGVTGEEIDFAKTSVTRKFPMNFETNYQMAMNLTAKVIHSLPDDYFDTYVENINNVSLKDVNDAALSTILPDEVFYIIVGDKKKILPQLKELPDMETVEVDINGNELFDLAAK